MTHVVGILTTIASFAWSIIYEPTFARKVTTERANLLDAKVNEVRQGEIVAELKYDK